MEELASVEELASTEELASAELGNRNWLARARGTGIGQCAIRDWNWPVRDQGTAPAGAQLANVATRERLRLERNHGLELASSCLGNGIGEHAIKE